MLKFSMLKIGDFARIGHVSIKALRHYDAIGLLPPAHVDRISGYRYYSAAQLPVLNRLLIYRNLGFSLSETRALLDEACPPARLRTLLEPRQAELSRRIEVEKAQLTEVMNRIRQVENEETVSPYNVVIRATDPGELISIRRTLPDYGALPSLFEQLRTTVSKPDIRAHGAIWHCCGSSGRPIDCEAFLLLKRPVVGSRPVGASNVVSVTHHNSEEDPFPQIYRAVLETIDCGDFEIVWPMREIYHSDDLSLTEVQFPIRKMNGDNSYAV